MKKVFSLVFLFVLVVFWNFENVFAKKKISARRSGSSSRRVSRSGVGARRAALAASHKSSNSKVADELKKKSDSEAKDNKSEDSDKASIENNDSYDKCMDNICMNNMSEEKGRCRCSAQLSRIEKVLRDIDKIQNEADIKNNQLETIMNVSDTAKVSGSLGNVYQNINSIEKKSKKMAFGTLDPKMGVMEGLQLYKKADQQCSIKFASDKDKLKTFQVDYQTKIEKDCSSYTSVLKDKADDAKNLLVQAQKNQEKFEQQEYKKLNQLDNASCYVEYETCMKTQCGENFSKCVDLTKQDAFIKKCRSINYGKCEANMSVILVDLKKYIAKQLEKERIAQNCRSAMGQIRNGQCVYQLQYRADKCSTGKTCGPGHQDEKWMLPGETVVCDDRRGSFKDIIVGCYESCYLVNGDKVRYLGTNFETNAGKNAGKWIGAILTAGISLAGGGETMPNCKGSGDLDRYTLPIPDGWAADGYPKDPDFKNEF